MYIADYHYFVLIVVVVIYLLNLGLACQLDKLVDIVVASPGRLLQHHKQGNVFLSQVSHIIIDEVDTMLTQGFGSDIREIIRASSVLRTNIVDSDSPASKKNLQLIMASATLTKAVKVLLEDVKSFNVAGITGSILALNSNLSYSSVYSTLNTVLQQQRSASNLNPKTSVVLSELLK
jgi:superfamily II DNA/RNA helicase